MIIIYYVLFYLAIGLFWSKLLENICIKYEVAGGSEFSFHEILFHILLWPVTSLVFFVSLIIFIIQNFNNPSSFS